MDKISASALQMMKDERDRWKRAAANQRAMGDPYKAAKSDDIARILAEAVEREERHMFEEETSK